MVVPLLQDSYGQALEAVVPKPPPLHYAPVTIVEGEQKSGKTCFCVTRVVDPTFKYLTAIKLYNGTPEGIVVRAEPVLKPNGYAVINWAKIWMPLSSTPKIMPVPPRSILISDNVRIFANFHLKGIRYRYMVEGDIIAHLNDGTITGLPLTKDDQVKVAFLIIDEAYMAGMDKRRSLSGLAVVMSHLGNQFAKRHLNVMIALPNANYLGFRITDFETEHVVCEYDEMREIITARIRARKKYKTPREVPIQARQYFKYYDPDELKKMSNNDLASAIAAVS
jgi:hypothetical protein